MLVFMQEMSNSMHDDVGLGYEKERCGGFVSKARGLHFAVVLGTTRHFPNTQSERQISLVYMLVYNAYVYAMTHGNMAHGRIGLPCSGSSDWPPC